jgi:cell division protein FtsZ
VTPAQNSSPVIYPNAYTTDSIVPTAPVPPVMTIPVQAVMAAPTKPLEAKDEKILPRDMLLAKARAYRERQVQGPNDSGQEQLSLDVGGEGMLDRARKLSKEIIKSPFDNQNLDVPAYIRRKQLGEDQTGIE